MILMLIVHAIYYFAAVLSQVYLSSVIKRSFCEDSNVAGFMYVCVSLGVLFHVLTTDKIVTPVGETCQDETVT